MDNTDILRNAITTYVPENEQQRVLEALATLESLTESSEVIHVLSRLVIELPDVPSSEIFTRLQNELRVVEIAALPYLNDKGLPVGNLRVVAIDVYNVLQMLRHATTNRNFISEDDVDVLISNIKTWLSGRLTGVGKKCSNGVSTCRLCSTPFIDDDTGLRTLWRCPQCDAVRPMCKTSSLSNGRCKFHGGRSNVTQTFIESTNKLRADFLSGTRHDLLRQVMANPEDALSNAQDIYLLEVRMTELIDRLGKYTSTTDDIEELTEIENLLVEVSDPTLENVIHRLRELVAVILQREHDEQVWEMINDQTQNLNKLRLGEATIIKHTQSALNMQQKRKLADHFLSAVQSGIGKGVDTVMPLLLTKDVSPSDFRLKLISAVNDGIKKEL